MPTAYETAFGALTAEERSTKNVRFGLIAQYGYVVFTDADIDFIVARITHPQGAIEVGAGWGYLAGLLEARGITMQQVTDIAPPSPGQTWNKTFGDTARDDSGTAYHVEEVREEAANVTWVGHNNRVVVCAAPEFPFDGIANYNGPRVIVAREDGYEQHHAALLADGWQITETRVMPLNWPSFSHTIEVWERV